MNKTKRIGAASAAILLALSMSATAMVTPMASAATAGSTGGKYYTDFATYEEELEYAERLNQEIFADSVVLMKNKNNALPLNIDTESDISLVGMLSYNIITGGTGSGAGNGGDRLITIEDNLKATGFNMNEKAANAYKNSTLSTGSEAPSSILNSASGSFKFYGDAVIWTIGRVGGEGNDLAYFNTDTNKDTSKHALELNDNELDMLEYLEGLKDAGTIKKLVVLVNSANVFEMAPLEDNDNVDAILWIGQPGAAGLGGLGRVLTGEVSPSGRTADIWNANHKNDPTWQNTGTAGMNGTDPDTGEAYTSTAFYKNAEGEYVAIKGRDSRAGMEESGKVIEYEEGIYMGYKYYETAAADGVLTDPDVGYVAAEGTIPAQHGADAYYNRSTGVVYPYGYGLSYTSFSQELVTTAGELEAAVNGKSKLDDKVSVQVTVTNTGNVAGKEVVQLYVHAPYIDGGIEKAEVSLVSFGKTGLLQPGESETVTMQVRLGDIASFDYDDANGNGWKGYEIEAGNYEFRLQKNSHEEIDALEVALTAKTTTLDNDGDATNNTPFSNGDDFDSLLNIKDKSTGKVDTPTGYEAGDFDVTGEVGGKMTIMSRAEDKGGLAGTFPTAPKASDMLYGKRVIELLYCYDDMADVATETSRYTSYADSRSDKPTDPWYKTEADIPASWTQGAGTKTADGKYEVQLANMTGIAADEEEWVEFMNQFTYEELITIISSSGSPAVTSVGKPSLSAADGPGQLSNGTFWCCEVNIGSTWDLSLAEKQGLAIGNESLFMGITGWWGPGVNIHRSPFGGRNFEYYSQDTVHAGLMVAAVVSAYESKGGIAYLKHFAVDDMENVRYGCGTFVDEQAMRENYLKVFEYGVKEGGAGAMMASHNRIGAIQNYGNWALTTAVAINEWGFDGYIQSDMYVGYSRCYSVLRSGASILMGSFSGNNKVTGTWDATVTRANGGVGAVRDGVAGADGTVPVSYTQWYAVRNAAQRLLYIQANSSVLDNGTDTSVFTDKTFEATQNVEFTASVGVKAEDVKATELSYNLEGALPAGLTFDSLTGEISGTPTESGEFTASVELVADGWVTKTATLTFKIKPTIEVTVTTAEPAVGSAFAATVTNNIPDFKVVDRTEVEENEEEGTFYTAASFSAEGLPAGLTIDEATGAISGTPTEAGTFTVIVKLNYTKTIATQGGFGPGPSDFEPFGFGPGGPSGGGFQLNDEHGSYVAEIVITIAGTGEETPEPPAGGVTAEDIADINDRLDALEEAISKDSGSTDGETSEGGCGSTVGFASLALAVPVIAAAWLVAAKARKRQDK